MTLPGFHRACDVMLLKVADLPTFNAYVLPFVLPKALYYIPICHAIAEFVRC